MAAWIMVPKDPTENAIYRRLLIDEGTSSRTARKTILEKCQDPLFWINSFVWQINPTILAGDQAGPFITWTCQDHAVSKINWCIDNGHDLLIEKSRDMGASWLILLCFYHRFLFRDWQKFHMISRNLILVDSSNPDSLFWKLDFVRKYLPPWMIPEGYERKMCYFGNPSNGSVITGEASTGKAGVGGRATAMGIDEFSQIEEDMDVLHRTSDTTRCRIFNFTHIGTDTAAYELTLRPDIHRLKLHWTQHPQKAEGAYRFDGEANRIVIIDKTYAFPPEYPFIRDGSPAGGPCPGIRSPWYDFQCKRKGAPRAIAMDLDIDPAGSQDQMFDRVLINNLIQHYSQEPVWTGHIDPGGKMVQGENGYLKLWTRPTGDSSVSPGRYGAGADLSQGVGRTNSCISVASADTGEKLAELATNEIPPDELAPIAIVLMHIFATEAGDPCLLCWEQQGPGMLFGKKVWELGFRRFYWNQNDLRQRFVDSLDKPGWYPSEQAKRLMLDQYQVALKNRLFLNRSKAALLETLSFRFDGRGKVEYAGFDSATSTCHGDRVIADGLCWKMIDQLGLRTVKKRKEDEVPVLSLAWRRQMHENDERQDRDVWDDT